MRAELLARAAARAALAHHHRGPAATLPSPGSTTPEPKKSLSLKQQADGPFTTLASFFRVVLSPHGRGHALVLLRSPQEANPAPECANICLHDNEPLARYLVAEFVSHFGAFRGLPGLKGLSR
jgi:hypothetical protein